MKKLRANTKVYYITVEDIQNVAEQVIERKLTTKEIMNIEDIIAENIPWYDAIVDAIRAKGYE